MVSTRPLFLAIFILRDIHCRNARLERGLNLGGWCVDLNAPELEALSRLPCRGDDDSG